MINLSNIKLELTIFLSRPLHTVDSLWRMPWEKQGPRQNSWQLSLGVMCKKMIHEVLFLQKTKHSNLTKIGGNNESKNYVA